MPPAEPSTASTTSAPASSIGSTDGDSTAPRLPAAKEDRVRAMLAEEEASKADGESVTVDCGSVASRAATLCPLTVGNQPLVLPVDSANAVDGVSRIARGVGGDDVRCATMVCGEETLVERVGEPRLVTMGEFDWLSRPSRESRERR